MTKEKLLLKLKKKCGLADLAGHMQKQQQQNMVTQLISQKASLPTPNPERLSLHREEEWQEQGGLYGKQVPADTVEQFYAHTNLSDRGFCIQSMCVHVCVCVCVCVCY